MSWAEGTFRMEGIGAGGGQSRLGVGSVEGERASLDREERRRM